MKGLLFAAALLLAPARACAEGIDPGRCAAFGSLGCYYVPASAKGQAEMPLLVYVRGWYGGHRWHVPAAKRLAAARLAFSDFKMGELAESEKMALLITGSSNLGVLPEYLEAMEKIAGARLPKLIVASHSGGWRGLAQTLKKVPAVERLILLDNFYFMDEDPSLARAIERAVQGGAVCTGFFTRHNAARYGKFSKLASCPADRYQGKNVEYHHDGVTECLGAYLERTSCH